MMTTTRSCLALATLVALAACSSNDDDGPASTTSETLELAGDAELSSVPGGDTSAIAGYWNASSTDPAVNTDSRFVLIDPTGLETSYELQQDDIDGSNCYSQSGPQTLSPGPADTYARADGTTFVAMRSDDDMTLTVTIEPGLVESWTLVEGRMASDLQLCSTDESQVEPGVISGPAPGDSMLNPDLVGEGPSPEPSGNDTTAVAGLWDATGGPEGRVDQRFVSVSADGLWTEYDFRQDDLSSDGNCYVITPFRLDLELGDASNGRYSIADGRTVDLMGTSESATLAVAFASETGEPETFSWPRVEGQSAVDLEACTTEE